MIDSDYTYLVEGLKSTTTADLEDAIAQAVKKLTNCTGAVSCSISRISHEGVRGAEMKLSLNVEEDEEQF